MRKVNKLFSEKKENWSKWFRVAQLASSTFFFPPTNKNTNIHLFLIWVRLTAEQVPRLEELMSCSAIPCKCTCKCHLGPIRLLLRNIFNPQIPQTSPTVFMFVRLQALLVFSRGLLGSPDVEAEHLFFWPRLCRTTPTGGKFSSKKLTFPILDVLCLGFFLTGWWVRYPFTSRISGKNLRLNSPHQFHLLFPIIMDLIYPAHFNDLERFTLCSLFIHATYTS